MKILRLLLIIFMILDFSILLVDFYKYWETNELNFLLFGLFSGFAGVICLVAYLMNKRVCK